VDTTATGERRAALRAERRTAAGLAGPASAGPAEGGQALDVNQSLHGRTVRCTHCGTDLGTFGEAYLAALPRIEGPPSGAGPHVWADPSTYVDVPVVFRQVLCPGCATALASQVVPADHPLPVDTIGERQHAH
jgi:N-methylhydantoinase B